MNSLELEIRAKELFLELYELSEEERERKFLALAKGDDRLALRVRELWQLSEQVRQSDFLENGDLRIGMDEPLQEKEIGPYLIERRIARGGMGVVYEALDATMDYRKVALKIPHLSGIHGNMLIQRLEREKKALARLNHRHIVKIYAAGVENDVPYIAMEYVEGVTLSELNRSTRIDPQDIVRWSIQLARALHYIHEADVLHRDIKPSNIIIDREGYAVLTDFGIARIPHASRITLANPGTLIYMCPEQRKNEEIDGRCDIYGLGLVMYELVMGQPPYPLDRSLLHGRSGVDKKLARVIKKCIEEDKNARFQTGAELADALGEIQPGRRAVFVGRLSWLARLILVIIIISMAILVIYKMILPPPDVDPIIESLRDQTGSKHELITALDTLRAYGRVVYVEDVASNVDPKNAYVFVFTSEFGPLQYILKPGEGEREDMLSSRSVHDAEAISEGRTSVWVSIPPDNP